MKKILSFALALIFVFSFFTAQGKEEFNGKGTKKEPYLIESEMDLTLLSDKVYNGEDFAGEYFMLTNDININPTDKFYSWGYNPPEKVWNPIGTARTYFKGNFDGNGKTISGIYLSDETKNYAGLFGRIKDGEIKNLTIEKSYVKGRNSVALVAGFAENVTIENVLVTGYVEGRDDVGGIAGYLAKGKIKNAVSEAEILSEGYGGGVAGSILDAEISVVASKGDITGELASGGIIGLMKESTVKNAYSLGDIVAESYGGGIAGYADEDSDIINAYAVGDIVSEKASGGIAGVSYCLVENVYFKGTVKGEYKGALVGVNSPLSEDSDLPDYGEIENAYFAEDKEENAVGHTLAKEDDHDIMGLKASDIDLAFIKKYILNPFISLENLTEAPDDVWVFKDKNPGLFIEYEELLEKEEENLPEEPSKEPEIGVKIGEVVSTDIRAYIDGKELKAVNIGGKMAIALKDLREFGFEVLFDEDKREVKVSYKGGEINSSFVYEDDEKEIGSYISDVLSTDIVAFLEGEKTESFNAEGYTHIYFRSLEAFGEVSFDEEKREAKLTLDK